MIWCVEDDGAIRDIELYALNSAGFETRGFEDGLTFWDALKKEKPELIILDVMLPGMDGFNVCLKLREKTDIPILLVTAKKDDVDKIRGLGLGADDYIEKPFSPSVLVARVKANIAQYKRIKSADNAAERLIEYGDITINPLTHRVFVKGKEVDLKNKEYELLLFFMNNIDIVFNKEQLYENVWGFDALGENSTVAVHINRLREKIEENLADPKYIITKWGVGYYFRK